AWRTRLAATRRIPGAMCGPECLRHSGGPFPNRCRRHSLFPDSSYELRQVSLSDDDWQPPDEDVDKAVAVPADEVGGAGLEAHELPLSANRGGLACAVRVSPARVDARPGSGPGHDVADEDVGCEVAVTGDEVGGEGIEDHEPPRYIDRRCFAAAVRVSTPGVHAHPSGGPGHQVPHEDVASSIAVPRHQVGGEGRECHEPTVRADRGREAGAVGVA